MQIKANGQYLELFPDSTITVDRQCKLFQELETTYGDFSYSMEIPATTKNLSALGFPFPDVASKSIYGDISCDVLGDDGIPIYTGSLVVEAMDRKKIEVTLYSGNTNWIALLNGNLSDLILSEYDTALTSTTIVNNRTNTSGVVFPLVDLGGLTTRGQVWLKSEDFTGAIYVKTLFNKIFHSKGIKYQGDLANDWLFNNMVIVTNNRNAEEIEGSSCFVEKSSTTTRPTENVDYKITWQNDSTGGYFDGENDAFDLANSRYVSPYKQTVIVECALVGSLQDANYSNRIRIYINGVYTFVDIGLSVGGLYNTAVPGDQTTFSIKRTITLNSGDILEIYSHWQESTGSVTPISVLTGTLKITPVYIYHVFGASMVPKWTQIEFVSAVLQLFNVVSDYNPVSKTVTFNLFEKLRTKTAIDISEYIDPSTISIDFRSLTGNFGRKNYLQYTEGDNEDLKIYNIRESVQYGAGTIAISNSNIKAEADILESKFTSPVSYINPIFNCSLERLNLISLEESDGTEFTAVAGGGTFARFSVATEFYQVNELVRVSDSTDPDLNGDWIVYAVGAGYIELSGTIFTETATGRVAKLNHRYTSNDSTFVLVHVPDYNIVNFSDVSIFNLDSASPTALSFSYFNLLDTSDTVNTGYLQGLSFGDVNNTKSYQKSLIDTYWRSVGNVLSDPVMVKAKFRFPNSVFRSLTPLTPVYLKTGQTSNMYYINQVRGYLSSKQPCEVELIKL